MYYIKCPDTLEKTLPPSRMLCACLFAANLENISAMSKNYIMSARLTILMEIWACACLFVQQYHFGGDLGVEDGKCNACGKKEEQHPIDPKGKEPRRFWYDFMYS